MQAPRTRAMKIGANNWDVLAAMFPTAVDVVMEPKDIFTAYIVINVSTYISSENYEGVGLINQIMTPTKFAERYVIVGKEIVNTFCLVKELPAKPIQQRTGFNSRSYKTPVHRSLSKLESSVLRIRG